MKRDGSGDGIFLERRNRTDMYAGRPTPMHGYEFYDSNSGNFICFSYRKKF